MWGSGVTVPQYLILPLDTGQPPDLLNGRHNRTTCERDPSTRRIEGWVDHRLTVTLDRTNVSCSCQQQQYDSWLSSPNSSHYTKIREPWNDSSKHVLENYGLHNPEFSINVYVMPQVPSALKSMLKSNIWFKRKFSDWKKNSDQTCYFVWGISSSGEVGVWVGTTMSGVVGLAAAVLTLVAAFFFDFPAAGLVAAVDLCSGFLGLAVFLVAVNLGCSGASVTGWGEEFGLGGGAVVVALITRPPRTT